jgi:hypothetical protein
LLRVVAPSFGAALVSDQFIAAGDLPKAIPSRPAKSMVRDGHHGRPATSALIGRTRRQTTPMIAEGSKFDTLVEHFHRDQIPWTCYVPGDIATTNTGLATLSVAGTDPRADRGTMPCR